MKYELEISQFKVRELNFEQLLKVVNFKLVGQPEECITYSISLISIASKIKEAIKNLIISKGNKNFLI